MKTRFISSLSLFLVCFFVFSQQTEVNTVHETTVDANIIPIDPKVKIGKLSNGLTYYIQNNGKPEDKVELRLVINAGSILENENQLGLAHFMEHMNFNGTKNFQKNEMVDYLQSIGVEFGADLNAYTSFDQTVYILPIPSNDPEKLEKGFQVLEDWAHNATLTDEAIDEERGVVLEEYRLGLGPDKRMMQEYLPKLMHGSQYAKRLPIGTKENLENFSYEDLRSYFRVWYRPNLMAVIAVGDLDVETLENKIKEKFGHIKNPANPKERPEFHLPNHDETFVTIVTDKEAPFSQVQVMYKDNINSENVVTTSDFRKSLLHNLFGTMINNRLSELTNKPNPPFVFGFSSYSGTFARTKNAYQSGAFTSETGQLNALKTLLEENERVKRYGFQDGEFNRAKKQILARLEKQFKDKDKQESNRIVGAYISHFLNQSPIPGIEWRFKMTTQLLETVNLEEINQLINGFIHDNNRVIILTGPEKEGLDKVEEKAVLEILETVKKSDLQPYNDGTTRDNLIEEILTAGTITSSSNNDVINTTTLTLSNGAKVTYKKTDFKNDEVLFQAYSFGGSNMLSDSDYKAASLAFNGLSEAGIGGLTKVELNKMMSGKIASVSPFIQVVTEGLRGQAAPKDLEILFQQVYLYFTNLNKNEEAFQSYISKQSSFLGNLMANPQFYFSNEVGKTKNQGNSRYIGFPTPETLAAADYSRAYNIYKERFANAGDFHFFFVGNIDESLLKQYTEQYLGALPATKEREGIKPTEFREKDEFNKFVVKKGQDPKSQVQITWREDDIPYSAEKNMHINLLGDILSIKLIEKLREQEAGVYGAGARGSFRKLSFPGVTFNISFPCGPENVDKLIEAALAEVEKIKTDGPTQKDLDKVKESMLIKNSENLKKNQFWLSSLISSSQYDEDPARVLKTADAINDVTLANIKNVANAYLDGNYFLAILMPEDN